MPDPALPLPALRCPLCGGPNECAVAQSGRCDAPCWCADIAIDPKALAAIPEAERNMACLCPRCAATTG